MMVRKLGWVLAGLLLSGLAYLSLAPVPIDPLAWQPRASTGYVGPHQSNQRLSAVQLWDLHGEVGPEHIALGPDGKLYTGLESGKIVRMQADGTHYEVFAETGGRPLGFDFDAQGNLYLADAMLGLMRISSDGHKTLLSITAEAGGEPVYADSVVVAKTGKVYLTDASTRFSPVKWGGTFRASVLDILEHQPSGRVIEYEPASGKSRLIMQHLGFANGVALSEDEQSLFISETSDYRIWKVDIHASAVSADVPDPRAKVLLDNLPGYPDNLMRGKNGRLWVGLTKPRSGLVDKMGPHPWMRKAVLRLPERFWPVPPAYGHVVAFDESGKVVADLQDPSGRYPETSGALEVGNGLVIQSLHAHNIAWLPDLLQSLKSR